MFRIFKNIIPCFLTLLFVFLYYYEFYKDSIQLLNILFVFGCMISLLCTLPPTKKRVTAVFFLFMPFLAVFSFTYNFLFSVAAVFLSIILGLLMPKKRTYTRIVFDEDCTPSYIKHTVKKPFPETLSFMRNVFLCIIVFLVVFSFVFPSPNALWLTRAFPINLTTPETFQGEVIPLGTVTSTAWYDDKAILIDSFFDIDDSIPSPGKEAGLKEGDIVVEIDGQKTLDSDFISNGADENSVTLTVKRASDTDFETLKLKVTPKYSQNEGRYLIGINYYSAPSITASVQTLTFAYPDTGFFAGTAHSSDDVYEDMNSLKGVLFLSSVEGRDEEGLIANPTDIYGVSLHTDNYGCYGVLNLPEGETLPIAEKHEFRPGKAVLLSTVEGATPREYTVYITGTYRIDSRDVMYLIVTDPILLEKGGITRGMSGSPIIQNGKIIGALSNMDAGGRVAYATFAKDMAHMLYSNSDKLTGEE